MKKFLTTRMLVLSGLAFLIGKASGCATNATASRLSRDDDFQANSSSIVIPLQSGSSVSRRGAAGSESDLDNK